MLDQEVYKSEDLEFIRQRCFDCAYEQILLQEGIAYSSELGSCMYYHEGNRCAVGWILPEEVAMSLSDYTGSATDDKIRTLLEELFPNLSTYDLYGLLGFLRKLQYAHDSSADLALTREEFNAKFKHQMKRLSDVFNLDTYVLEETDA